MTCFHCCSLSVVASPKWNLLVFLAYYLYLLVTNFLVISDEREISPSHKFYASLEDGDPPKDDEEEVYTANSKNITSFWLGLSVSVVQHP